MSPLIACVVLFLIGVVVNFVGLAAIGGGHGAVGMLILTGSIVLQCRIAASGPALSTLGGGAGGIIALLSLATAGSVMYWLLRAGTR